MNIPISISIIEYVILRLLRRYCFRSRVLDKFSTIIPYYQKNFSSFNPDMIVDKYFLYSEKSKVLLSGKKILEIGSGSINSTLYELSARGCGFIYGFEPYAKFDSYSDEKMLSIICRKYNFDKRIVTSGIKRTDSLDDIIDGSIDVIFSHSVLEHVSEPYLLLSKLKRKMKSDGVMIHIVDYRDHFFKYPYHILLFSKKTWNKWLNPGDLPGWRLGDHLRTIKEAGLDSRVECVERDLELFNRIAGYISNDYTLNDELVSVLQCVILMKFPENVNLKESV